MLDRPILVTGSPRSGKTLVANILGASPEFYMACEPLLLWDAVMPNRPDDRRTEADVGPKTRESLIAALSRPVEKAGRSRYVDDLAQHTLRIPFIAAVLPEARFVHVVRDGRSVVPEFIRRWSLPDTFRAAIRRRSQHVNLRSLPRHLTRFISNYWSTRIHKKRVTWGPRVPGLAEFAASHSVAETASFQWRSLIEFARRDLAKLPPDRWMEVRYEHLAADPAGVARQLAAFAEASDPRACEANATATIQPGWIDPKATSERDIPLSDFARFIAPLQRELGYEMPAAQFAPA